MLDCCEAYESTQRNAFKSFPPGKYAEKAQKKQQTDETLITGHFKNNLQVNGKAQKSKVWPAFGVEEYKDYLKRLECCKKEVYKMYFRCPEVDLDHLDKMLQSLEKSTYQLVFSPNEYIPRKEARRFAKSNNPANLKYYDTTYRTYYNRIEELIRFKDVLYGFLPKHDKEELRNDLKRIYRTGTTTYHANICVPAIELLKCTPLQSGPIDRYTLRHI